MAGTEQLEPIRLTHPEKVALVDIARAAILNHLTHSSAPAADENTLTDALKQLSGAFVSLHIGDELRGCIGSIYAEEPLTDIVAHMAVKAATQDQRFAPMMASDLNKVDIEISVLSELSFIDPEKVQVGLHGLLLSKGSRRGLLLPQVPEQYGWTQEQYLDQLCIKAGLPEKSWKESDCRLQMFTADVFSESTLFEDEDYE